jgi:hypothetical protein
MFAGTAAGDGAAATPDGGRDAPGDAAAAARAIVAESDAAEGAPAVGRGAEPTEVALGDAVDAAGGGALFPVGSTRVVPHCTQNLAPGWVS